MSAPGINDTYNIQTDFLPTFQKLFLHLVSIQILIFCFISPQPAYLNKLLYYTYILKSFYIKKKAV